MKTAQPFFPLGTSNNLKHCSQPLDYPRTAKTLSSMLAGSLLHKTPTFRWMDNQTRLTLHIFGADGQAKMRCRVLLWDLLQSKVQGLVGLAMSGGSPVGRAG